MATSGSNPEPESPETPEAPGAQGDPDKDNDENDELTKAAIIKRLEELEPSLDTLEVIAEAFHEVPLICMSANTKMRLCHRLDPPSDIQTDENNLKDYRGMAEWIQLDTAFVNHLTKTECIEWKTTEVLATWSIRKEEPIPTLGNLQRCLCGEGGIDRPDVITDLATIINRDAFQWEMEKYRANTTKSETKDVSWQLTIQDVITGKKTYYTACLVYADEDDGTAEVIHRLYTRCYPEATFFRPQFDMIYGKYELATTGAVIQDRCGGKVIFLVSKYFLASHVCQFAANFSAAVCKGATVGKLIPFLLTDDEAHMPIVLRGLTGVRWFHADQRRRAWRLLTAAILEQNIQQEKAEEVNKRISDLVNSKPSLYLGEAPYDEDIGPAGAPIEIIETDGIEEYIAAQNQAFQSKTSPPPITSSRDTLWTRFKAIVSRSNNPDEISAQDSDKESNHGVPEDNDIVNQQTNQTESPPYGTHRESPDRTHCEPPDRTHRAISPCGVSRDSNRNTDTEQHCRIGPEDLQMDSASINGVSSVENGITDNDVNSLEESCQVQISSDRSSVMFKKSNSCDSLDETS